MSASRILIDNFYRIVADRTLSLIFDPEVVTFILLTRLHTTPSTSQNTISPYPYVTEYSLALCEYPPTERPPSSTRLHHQPGKCPSFKSFRRQQGYQKWERTATVLYVFNSELVDFEGAFGGYLYNSSFARCV